MQHGDDGTGRVPVVPPPASRADAGWAREEATEQTSPAAAAAGDAPRPVGEAAAVAHLLDGGAVHPVFQPIVDLATGRVLAYEALVRGPRGHHLEAPTAMFEAARSASVLTALDATCLRAAVGEATASGLRSPWTLFVNTEPDSRTFDVIAELAATSTLPVVVELTERALTDDPAEVLGTVALLRRLGWGVALDDVGVNPDSLSLLPLIAPDVIKLDAALVQHPPDERTARVFSAVAAEAERTGCLLLAEGIETPEHLRAARAMGAHLGQGWLFGPPGHLPTPPGEPPRTPIQLRPAVPSRTDLTPFGVTSAARQTRTTDKALLEAMSKHLERQAAAAGESCLVLTTFQTAAAFARAAQRYTALADANVYVAAFGSDLPDHPAGRIRGVNLDRDEPLAGEWDVVIVGPHFAVVLAAHPATTSADPLWNYVLTHDRDLAVRAAGALMNRITAAAELPVTTR